MNRIIKFRAWDTKNKNWLKAVPPDEYMLDSDDWSAPDYDDMCEALFVYPNNPLGSTFNDRIIFQQFTGLKDKNGKEIYEGDIVSFLGRFQEEPFEELVGLVNYSEYIAAFAIQRSAGHFPSNYWYFFIESYVKDVEIIGNIYENPELRNKN